MTAPAPLIPYPVNALLFLGALLPALFFKGVQLEYFAASNLLLMAWLGRVLWLGYPQGWAIPRTSFVLALTLLWVWFGVSAIISPAVATSTVNFWWLGALPLVFWLYTLSPDRDAIWRFGAPVVLLVALTLAVVSMGQVFVADAAARSVFETRNSHAAFLNLVALPASAYFLLAWRQPAVSRGQRVFLGAAVFVLFVSVFLTAGRAAALSLLIAFVVLCAFVWRHVERTAVWVLVGLLVSAFGITQVSHGELGTRLPVFTHDVQREYIWRSSWAMIQDHPWFGVGLGLFFLAYPPYRNFDDSSGGFFAHSDYLQFWAETGLPGLLLLLGVLTSVAWLTVRAWRVQALSADVRVEVAGLFVGLLAIAGHSAVDFNFYILSILMVAGLALGRWHQQIAAALSIATVAVSVGHWFRWRTYVVNVVMVVAIGLVYFLSVGATNSLHDRASARARDGDVDGASRTLSLLTVLNPRDDRAPLTHADLLRHVLRLEIARDAADRRALFEDAVQYLEEAEAANSLRPQSYVVRARLYREQPALAGPRALELASAAYERALQLNPLLVTARTEFAQWRLDQGHAAEAGALLDAGIRYQYAEGPEVLAFYRLAADTLRAVGRPDSAKEAEARLAALEAQMGGRVNLRPQ